MTHVSATPFFALQVMQIMAARLRRLLYEKLGKTA